MTEIDRDTAKPVIHQALHDLNVRIVGLKAGDCHCNLVAEVILDALLPETTPAGAEQTGDTPTAEG